MDARDYVRIYVANFELNGVIDTRRIIEKALSYIPTPIRPGYSCPANPILKFAHWKTQFRPVAEVLQYVSDLNGWQWHVRLDDNRIMFDEKETAHES